MPITFEEALAATDPSLDNETKGSDGLTARERSAQAIVNGVTANDIYWSHQPPLEALKAQATGHSVVTRGGEEETPTGVGTGTDPNVIEGTATEEPVTALGTGESGTGSANAQSSETPAPSPDNPNEAIAKLRAQIVASGGTPEA